LLKVIDPLPVLPPNQKSDLGEGEQKLFMKIVITSQIVLTPPPFPLVEMGEGRVGVELLASHKSLAVAQSPQEKERLERQIEVTDRAIDSLVYELYGLTEDEIRIVRGKQDE